MRIQTLQFLIVFLMLGSVSVKSQAQVFGYNPFFVTNAYENIYRFDQGLLTLPIVTVLPSVNNPQEQLRNVVLQHTGGNSFELISVDELLPQEECTRAEVSAAIPQLDLGLTIAEAETLIGCSANIQPGRVDLDTGREVFAHWVGNDGVPNNPNGSFSGGLIGGGSTWIGGTAGGVFRSSVIGSPSIRFLLREDVLESISYSDTDQIRFCYTQDLLAGFRQVNFDDDYSTVVELLDCEGNLQGVSFDDTNLQQDYSWYAPPGPSGVPSLPSGMPQTLSETIQITMMNGKVQGLRYQSSKQYVSSAQCTNEDLILAESQLESGQAASTLSDLLDCGVLNESFTDNGINETTSYSWRTTFPNESVFLSPNRALRVTVIDGTIAFVRLDRF